MYSLLFFRLPRLPSRNRFFNCLGSSFCGPCILKDGWLGWKTLEITLMVADTGGIWMAFLLTSTIHSPRWHTWNGNSCTYNACPARLFAGQHERRPYLNSYSAPWNSSYTKRRMSCALNYSATKHHESWILNIDNTKQKVNCISNNDITKQQLCSIFNNYIIKQ